MYNNDVCNCIQRKCQLEIHSGEEEWKLG